MNLAKLEAPAETTPETETTLDASLKELDWLLDLEGPGPAVIKDDEGA